MEKENQIPFFAVYSDEYLKELVLEYLQLQDTGMFPPDSQLNKHGREIAQAIGLPYSLSLTIAILTREVFERFAIKQEKTRPLNF